MVKEDLEKLRNLTQLQRKKRSNQKNKKDQRFSLVFFDITKLNYFPNSPLRRSPNPPPFCFLSWLLLLPPRTLPKMSFSGFPED